MATTTLSSKYQIVIPKDVLEKLGLMPRQRFQVIEKAGIITLVPEVPIKTMKGFLKGMNSTGLREKKDRV